MSTKYIFVTGGVVSSLGKGIVAASLGHLLTERNYKVSIQKLDPYLNVDPGTMNPYQHGEVFVTEDGAETDLDLGHYERFIDTNLKQANSVTSGRIYSDVISKERRGEYLGATVQMVPHVTNEIKEKIRNAAKETAAEILIVEVGGTVGDIESSIFIEAIRQFKNDIPRNDTAYIHVTLVPHLKAADELKTKPTQHSVELLRSKGIQPDVIVLRSDKSIPKALREKVSLFTDVPVTNVIESKDCKSIYQVPLVMQREGLASCVLAKLNLEDKKPDLSVWNEVVAKLTNSEYPKLRIGLVGKYTKLSDAYISVSESIRHACAAQDHGVEIVSILSDDLDSYARAEEMLCDLDGIVVPGGFGDRGIEGKLNAVRWARENKKPFLGLCLGLQCAVIEFSRNVLGRKNANSVEFDVAAADPVIHLMEEQKDIEDKGATMRLGLYPCKIKPGTKAHQAYGFDLIQERHRHRYEFNNAYREEIEANGMVISGTSPDDSLVEMVEISDHPYFVACQFHPEFLSRPGKPHPLFSGLVKVLIKQGKELSQKAS
ncbi:MAG: CTP synthase [Cyanobacteria bacterium]|nr:CTP synthase [Cyanobacteriota bacterium]MDA1021066.1 CTP synthase [Cyanobacteriota bacterium]